MHADTFPCISFLSQPVSRDLRRPAPFHAGGALDRRLRFNRLWPIRTASISVAWPRFSAAGHASHRIATLVKGTEKCPS